MFRTRRGAVALSIAALIAVSGTAHAAAITWTGATLRDSDPNNNSNSWNTAANWNPTSVPGAGDSVTININDTISVPTAISINSLALSTSTLSGAGSLTITGSGSTWTGGTFGTTVTYGSGATVSLTGGSDKNLNGVTFTNNGVLNWSGGGRIGVSNGTIINNAGTFNVLTDGTVTVSFGGLATNFNNSGSVVRSGGSGNANFDNVIFNNTGAVIDSSGTTRLNAGGTDTGSFTGTGSGIIDFNGGTHIFNNGTSLGGTGHIRLSSGTINVKAAVPVGTSGTPGTLDFAGGTFSDTGSLTITGTVNWTGGTLSTTATLNATGTLAMSGSSDKNLSAGTFNNNGNATFAGTGRLGFSNGSTFNNAGTFTVNNDASVTVSFGGSASNFNNSGALIRGGGTGSANFDSVTFNNTGTVTEAMGTMRFNSGGTHTGTFTATGNGIIDFAGGTHIMNTNAKLLGTGHNRLSSGNMNLKAAIPVGVGGTPSNFDLTGGTLGDTGSMTVIGNFNWSGGTTSTTVTINAGSTLAMTGSSDKNLNAGTINNNGTSTFAGTGRIGFSNAGIFNNAGSFTVNNDATVTVNFGGLASNFNNSGTLTRGGGTGNANFDSVTFNNTGTVTDALGTTRFNSGGTHTGTFTATGSGIIDFAGGTHIMNTNAKLLGTGHNRLSSGNMNLKAAIPVGVGGTPSNFDLTGGTLGDTGSMTVIGSYNWTGGTTSTTVTINAGSTLAMTGSSDKNLNAGTINNSGGASWTGTGRIGCSNGAIFNNGGTFTVNGDGTVTVYFGGTGCSFNNTGTVTRASGTGNANFDGIAFNNSGAVTDGFGTTRFDTGGTDSGSFTATGAGIIDFANGTHIFNSGASLGGSGHIRLSGGNINLKAAITVGSSGTPGTFDLTGGRLGDVGSLTTIGNFNWTSGTVATTVQINSGSAITMTGSSDKNLDGGTLNNSGVGNWTGTGRIACSNGAVFNNGGTFTVNGDGSVTVYFGGVGCNFNNTGTLTRASGTGNADFDGVAFNNSGAVTTATGTLRFSSGGSDSGSFTATGPGIIQFTGGTHTLNSGAAFGGTGHVSLTSGTLALKSAIPVGVLNSPGIFDLVGGNLGDTGSLVVTGTMNWMGGTNNSTITINSGSTLALSGSSDKGLDAGTVNNAGTVNWTDGRITVATGVNINNQAGGVFNWLSNTNVVDFGGVGSNFNNSGIVNLGPPIRQYQLGTSFNQTATGTLLFLIGGATPATEYDQLAVSRAVNLDGSIGGMLINSFEPTPLQRFDVMTYPSRTGAFAQAVGVFTVDQDNDSVSLVAFDKVDLEATLYAEQEVQAPASDAVATALATINPARTRIAVSLGSSGLVNVTAAHVHIGGLGQNGPIAFSLYSTSDGPFPDLLEKDLTVNDFIPTVEAPTLMDAFNLIIANGAYINVHTQANPGGEIRGQVLPITLQDPTYGSAAPLSGPFGASVKLTGTNFTGPVGVRLNHVQVPATLDTSSQITVTISNNASTGEFVIFTPTGIAHGTETFIVVPPPTIDSFSPGTVAIGNSVTINGTNLTNATTPKPIVRINGTLVPDSGVTVNSSNQVVAIVPVGATSGPISVQTTGGTATSANSITVIPRPVIIGFTPTTGPVGTLVTITGVAFTNITTTKPTVKFNGTTVPDADVALIAGGHVTAKVPAGATTGKISVQTTGGVAQSATNFTVVAPPTISSFTPNTGPVGGDVTINGTNLTNPTTAKPTVKFNTTVVPAADVTVVSSSQIRAKVPAGTTTGKISVETTGGVVQSAAVFTLLPIPTVTSFTPTSGPVGTVVSITGTNFNGLASLKFNGVNATFSVISATSVRATVPAGATTGTIGVANSSGSDTSSNSFTVTAPPAPTIGSLTPTSGPVGTQVNINGTNLTSTSSVKFNGVSANFVIGADNLVQATVPSGATTGKVSLTAAGGSATSAATFTVTAPPSAAPTISSFTPTTGKVGTAVNITGTNFSGITSVRFKGTSSVFTVLSPTSIRATVPFGAISGTLTVSNAAGTATSAASFTVQQAPSIATFSPASGVVQTDVTITGANFTGATIVRFNNKSTTTFTVVSDTQIKVKVPIGTVSGPVAVTTPVGSSADTGNFLVLAPPNISTFSPASGPVGTVVTISGTGFTGLRSLKFFNDKQPAILSTSDTRIVAIVPSGATTGPISISTNLGSMSTKGNFFVTPSPSSPTRGPLSAASANAAGTVTLTFAASLDSDTAGDTAHYTVVTSGRALDLESAAYNPATRTVTLGLAEGALQAGDQITVAWAGLLDGGGGEVTGQTTVTAR